jgi:hypothetical protein
VFHVHRSLASVPAPYLHPLRSAEEGPQGVALDLDSHSQSGREHSFIDRDRRGDEARWLSRLKLGTVEVEREQDGPAGVYHPERPPLIFARTAILQPRRDDGSKRVRTSFIKVRDVDPCESMSVLRPFVKSK